MDAVRDAVGQPCADKAAQNAQQQTGQHVGRVMHAGIEPGKRDQDRQNIGSRTGFAVEEA